MRILSFTFPHYVQKSEEVIAVMTPSQFPLAMTAQQLAKTTLQTCKWDVSISGGWSVKYTVEEVVGGIPQGDFELTVEAEITDSIITLDNRSTSPESALVSSQAFNISNTTSGGIKVTGTSSRGVDTSVYRHSVLFECMQNITPTEYGIADPMRWLYMHDLFVPQLRLRDTPSYWSGTPPLWPSMPLIATDSDNSSYVVEADFLGEVLLVGVDPPRVGGPPPAISPGDGIYAWDPVMTVNLGISVTPSEFRPYDPGDGLGPIYDTTTGALIRAVD